MESSFARAAAKIANIAERKYYVRRIQFTVKMRRALIAFVKIVRFNVSNARCGIATLILNFASSARSGSVKNIW